jgi:hypothetical protein
MTITATTTAASSDNLTTLEAIKLEIGIVDDLSLDSYFRAQIQQASAEIHSITGQYFPQERVTEQVAGLGMKNLSLIRRPLVTIHEILSDSDPITDYEIGNADAGILFREAGWRWTSGNWWGIEGTPVTGEEDWQFSIDYTAGYLTPQQVLDAETGTRTLPFDIERACIELIKGRYYSRDRDANIVSERIGDYAVTYSQTLGVQAKAMDLLAPWIAIV